MCLSSLLSRHNSSDSVSGGGVRGQSGQHLCHFGPAEPAFPADLTHGANGPKRGHLEAAGLCGLRTQQGRWEGNHRLSANTLTHTLLLATEQDSMGTGRPSWYGLPAWGLDLVTSSGS